MGVRDRLFLRPLKTAIGIFIRRIAIVKKKARKVL